MLIDKYLFTGFRVHHITFLLLLSVADRNLLIFALLLRNIPADFFLHAVRFLNADFFGIVNANFTWNFRGHVVTNLFRDGLAYLQVLVSTLLYFFSACNLPFYVGTLLTGNLFTNVSVDIMARLARNIIANHLGGVSTNSGWDLHAFLLGNFCTLLFWNITTFHGWYVLAHLFRVVLAYLTGNLLTFSLNSVGTNLVTSLLWGISTFHGINRNALLLRDICTYFDLTTSTVISQCTFFHVVCTYLLNDLIAFSFRFIGTNLVTILLWDILGLRGRHIMTLLFCNIIANFLGD